MDFYVPILFRSHEVNSISFPLSIPSLSFIPILMGFPLGYSHSHLIPKHEQHNISLKCKCIQSTAEQQKNHLHRKLDTNR